MIKKKDMDVEKYRYLWAVELSKFLNGINLENLDTNKEIVDSTIYFKDFKASINVFNKNIGYKKRLNRSLIDINNIMADFLVRPYSSLQEVDNAVHNVVWVFRRALDNLYRGIVFDFCKENNIKIEDLETNKLGLNFFVINVGNRTFKWNNSNEKSNIFDSGYEVVDELRKILYYISYVPEYLRGVVNGSSKVNNEDIIKDNEKVKKVGLVDIESTYKDLIASFDNINNLEDYKLQIRKFILSLNKDIVLNNPSCKEEMFRYYFKIYRCTSFEEACDLLKEIVYYVSMYYDNFDEIDAFKGRVCK